MCKLVRGGGFSWTTAELLVIWEALPWSCQGFVRTVQQRMRRETAKLSLLGLSPLYRTEISENEMTDRASHCFTWVLLRYKKHIKWRNLSEHYIGKNQLFGCCRHTRWTSVLSACTLKLWKPYPLRNQSSFKQCLDNAWHAGELTGAQPKYVCVYTACAYHEAELSFTTIIPQCMLLCWCTEVRCFLFITWSLCLVGRGKVLSYVDLTRPSMAILVGASCVGEELREKQRVCYMLDPDTDGKKKIFEVLLCALVFCFP